MSKKEVTEIAEGWVDEKALRNARGYSGSILSLIHFTKIDYSVVDEVFQESSENIKPETSKEIMKMEFENGYGVSVIEHGYGGEKWLEKSFSGATQW